MIPGSGSPRLDAEIVQRSGHGQSGGEKALRLDRTILLALEVIREIVGFGEGLVGRLLMVDARAMRFETVTYGWDPENPLNGEHPTIRDLSLHR